MDKNNPRKGDTFVFADEKERTVYPLTIKALRKFVKIIEKMNETSNAAAMSEEDIDMMMEASKIILEKVDPNLVADSDKLEEAVDLVVFNGMMQVAMGNSSPEV